MPMKVLPLLAKISCAVAPCITILATMIQFIITTFEEWD